MVHLGLCAGTFVPGRRLVLRTLPGAQGRRWVRSHQAAAAWGPASDIVFIFLINPLATYLGYLRAARHPSLAHYLGGTYGAGPLWFVAALLAFSLAYALLRQVHPPSVTRRWPGAQVMVAAAVLIAVTAFLVWRRRRQTRRPTRS